MGWNFTVTPYDEDAWAEVARVASGGSDGIRARLDAEVPRAERSPYAIEVLEDASTARWACALFLVLAARGPGVFLGRSTYVAALRKLASGALADELRALESAEDPVLSEPHRGDPEDHRHRWPPETVARVAAAGQPLGVPPLSPAEIDDLLDAWRSITGNPVQPGARLTDDHPAVRRLGRTAAEVVGILGLDAEPTGWRRLFGLAPPTDGPLLRLFVGHLAHLAAVGLGAVLSHDGLGPSLRAPAGEGVECDLPPVRGRHPSNEV